MKNKVILMGILVAAGILTLFMWRSHDTTLSAFGLNALTEILGVICTVFIVDVLMTRHEELRSLPQRQTAYEDVRLLVSRVISFWSDIYRLSVPEACPGSVNALFTDDSFNRMMQCLNMSSTANVSPQRTWFVAFPQGLKDHMDRANTILQRHNSVLDPTAYRCVHSLTTTFDPGLIAAICQSDHETGCPRPTVLGSYFFLPSDYLYSILELVKWCRAERDTLARLGKQGLFEIAQTIGPWDRLATPPSMISPELLAQQLNAMSRFQAGT